MSSSRLIGWKADLVEVDRLETEDPAELVAFLDSVGLAGEPAQQSGEVQVSLLIGARGCARFGGVPEGKPSPVAVPEIVAIAQRPGAPRATSHEPVRVGEWTASWTDAEHARAVQQVRDTIARGEVYQANVVGHRSAPYTGDARALAPAVVGLSTGGYAGSVASKQEGDWVVASASPEQLVRVVGDRITTVPIKGTSASEDELRASAKDRAEHVMIVDLERNDLARVTEPGSVVVEDLYALAPWAGLWHASSTVAGSLTAGVTVIDVLRAVLPGGSVTGAPKHAACALLAELEPVGRGVSMGALGIIAPGSIDLGLTIRTIAAAEGQVHLWSGGGITWGSDPEAEVREAQAKADPVMRALAQVRPSRS